MTEKHIWENGETITADLLNGMSDYADEKVDAIPKIDPDTLVKTTALASDVNLLGGTSDEWQTWTGNPSTTGGWLIKEHDDITLMDVTDLSYSIEIQSAPVDGHAIIVAFKDGRTDGVQFLGNVVKAGESGMSTLSIKLPDGYKIIHVVAFQSTATTTGTAPVKLTYRREKLNVGPYATPYCDQAVTDVGGQKPVGGHINMDAYPKLANYNNFSGTNNFVNMPTINGQSILIGPRPLTDGANIDYIPSWGAGAYIFDTDVTITGAPSGEYGTILQIGDGTTAIVTQLWIGYSGSVFTRVMRKPSGGWLDWQQMATKAAIDKLNNTVSALQSQISRGGGVNLLDVTNGELGNLSGNDGSLLDGFKNLYRTPNMIPVSDDATYLLNIATPGDEKPVIEKVCFYDANGNFTRKSFAQAARFGFTPQNGECFIRFTIVSAQATPGFPDDVSWTKYGVTLTVTNSLETRLAALEAKINGGTTA